VFQPKVMRRIAALFVLLAAMSNVACGVVPIGPDVEHFDLAYFHSLAQVTTEYVEYSRAPQHSVQPGAHTVLVSSKGYTRGKRSSAHAGHFTFWFTLPEKLEAGQSFSVTQDDGTLNMTAFAGYSFWYLDRQQPAQGTVSIRSVTKDTIVADVHVHATAVYDKPKQAEDQRRREPQDRIGTFEFTRRSIPKPPRSRDTNDD
jgi:hypothetical protein